MNSIQTVNTRLGRFTMPHLIVQQCQHAVSPVKLRGLPELFSNASSPPGSPVSYSSSPPVSFSPASPGSGASPSNSAVSPAKSGKKKARNRPPKHVRKGTSLARKADELQPGSPQQGLVGILAANLSQAAMYSTHDLVESQPSNRVVSAPIDVPGRLTTSDMDEPRLEAFSSPKWLGTGFSDRPDVTVMCSTQHCSGPTAHTATFTYFARSMW